MGTRSYFSFKPYILGISLMTKQSINIIRKTYLNTEDENLPYFNLFYQCIPNFIAYNNWNMHWYTLLQKSCSKWSCLQLYSDLLSLHILVAPSPNGHCFYGNTIACHLLWFGAAKEVYCTSDIYLPLTLNSLWPEYLKTFTAIKNNAFSCMTWLKSLMYLSKYHFHVFLGVSLVKLTISC